MLRDYQSIALDQIREHYRAGRKKVLLKLATGGGKTTVFCEILKGVYNKGGRAIMVVRGRKLVDQAHKRLFREQVPHGVTMANHWNFRPRERIQICSIDTLVARQEFPDADLVVIDECHQAISPGYLEVCKHYQDKFFLPVTATPYVPKSMRHMADHVVFPITTQALIDKGFLVPAVYYVPGEPDLSGVGTRNGDYINEELSNVMDRGALIGDAVTQWKKLAENKRSIYFCVSVQHSKNVAAAFNAAGIPAVHCDADSKEHERDRAISKLQSGEIRVITNCGIFCTGVDIPEVEVIGMLRPTQSYNLYIQIAGRGTRPFFNKNNFLLIDHAGNVRKHGFINEEPEFSLDGKIKKFLPSVNPSICENCMAAFLGSACKICGWGKRVRAERSGLELVDGDLVKLEAIPPEEAFFRQCERTQKMYGYKRAWIHYKMRDRFGIESAEKWCPIEEKKSSAFWRGR